MKKKVNLKIVEGDEFSVAKNELLYNKVNGEVSLKKRNSKGVLEEITKGNLENKNIVQLYPEDKSKAVTEDDLKSLLNKIDKGYDSFWQTTDTPWDSKVIVGNTEDNKNFILDILDTLKSWTPEKTSYSFYTLYLGNYNGYPNLVMGSPIEEDSYTGFYLAGIYATTYTVVQIFQSEGIWYLCASAAYIYRGEENTNDPNSIKTLLNLNDITKVTTTSVTKTYNKSLLIHDLISDGAVSLLWTYLSQIGKKLPSFFCVVASKDEDKTILEGGFVANFEVQIIKNYSTQVFFKGTIDATPADDDNFNVTTTVTSVSN